MFFCYLSLIFNSCIWGGIFLFFFFRVFGLFESIGLVYDGFLIGVRLLILKKSVLVFINVFFLEFIGLLIVVYKDNFRVINY